MSTARKATRVPVSPTGAAPAGPVAVPPGAAVRVGVPGYRQGRQGGPRAARPVAGPARPKHHLMPVAVMFLGAGSYVTWQQDRGWWAGLVFALLGAGIIGVYARLWQLYRRAWGRWG